MTNVVRIEEVHLHNFRCVAGDLVVQLRDEAKSPSSVLLMCGENGAGKSSIIDGIEFAAQCLVGGWSPRSPLAPSARYRFARPGSASFAEIRLSDGTAIHRALVAGVIKGKPAPAPPFDRARLVVRRRDLESIMSVQDNERRTRLAGFLQAVGPWLAGEDIGEALDLRDRLAMLKTGVAEAKASIDRLRANGSAPGEIAPIERSLTKQQGHLGDIVHQLKVSRSRRSLEQMEGLLKAASATVTTGFKTVFPRAEAIDEIQFFVQARDDPHGRADLGIRLIDGHAVPPIKILSEAMLDTLAFLALVSLIDATVQQHDLPRVLILDDVFQSVDATARLRLGRFVFEHFADWQLILTFHDRAWFDEFDRQALKAGVARRHLFVSAAPGVGAGPRLQGVMSNHAVLRAQLAASPLDPQVVAGKAGVVLEELLDWLSFALEVPLPRRRVDKYTLDELWIPVRKRLSEFPVLRDAIADIDSTMHLRNVVGAHFSSASGSVTMAEVRDFGDAVIGLWDHFYCPVCERLPKKIGRVVNCACGRINFIKS